MSVGRGREGRRRGDAPREEDAVALEGGARRGALGRGAEDAAREDRAGCGVRQRVGWSPWAADETGDKRLTRRRLGKRMSDERGQESRRHAQLTRVSVCVHA